MATLVEGGTGMASLDREMPMVFPERLEAGTLPTPAIAGLCEGIKWLKTSGISSVRAHEEKLYTLLCDLFQTNEKIILYKMSDYPANAILFIFNFLAASMVLDINSSVTVF